MRDSAPLSALVRAQAASGHYLAAICAAPAVVLEDLGVLEGRSATCYPAFQDRMTSCKCLAELPVVVDGNLVTSQGPGTALDFAITLAALLKSEATALEVAEDMCADTSHL